ncbi:alpha/beta hydrolase [Nocardia sp. NPDC051321]|uniref:alpha/beta hydrolase n=1 Tax=Nocardia sp. NPDC051321 TaxID=3364323 RepID=UPI00378FB0B1
MPLDRILRGLIRWQTADGPPQLFSDLPVEEARRRYLANAIGSRRDRSGSDAIATADHTFDVGDGSVRVRTYTPREDAERVVTYLHGGGWVLGDIESHDGPCRGLAALLDAIVVSVDYRRAPEFPYPTPLYDAIAAAGWTARRYPGRVHVIAGDSAGANMAVGVAVHARDAGDFDLTAQLLLYPPVDPSLSYVRDSECAEGYLLTGSEMHWFYDQYLPDRRLRNEPGVALLHADLRGLPPAIVGTAEFDPLRAEGEALADKLGVEGVAVTHIPGPGLVHGFFLMQDLVPAAAAHGRRIVRELDTLLTSAHRDNGIRGQVAAAEFGAKI